jgi:acyl carrier protein
VGELHFGPRHTLNPFFGTVSMPTSSKLRAIIEQTVAGFNASALQNDQVFRDAGIDSLDHLNILLAVEEQFGVEIPDEDSKSLNTLNALLTYLEAR